ncbi:hypothetical protein ACH5RR_041015 [Cinchona calisaya]|uniref:Reverse transcriptase n=1 Tax=Cinchona calisaya TaxID=153742 RepID=A0ABD2XTD0_9GENT
MAVTRNAPKVSYLHFADDTFLFGNATIHEVETILNITIMYGGVSGQQINFDKSAVVFSKATTQGIRQAISSHWGIPEVESHQKYLGLLCYGMLHLARQNSKRDPILNGELLGERQE